MPIMLCQYRYEQYLYHYAYNTLYKLVLDLQWIVLFVFPNYIEHYENREAKYGIRDGVDKAIKQYIYSKKDAVIDRVVERASVEIVKRGLPKLLNRLGDIDNE